MCKLASCLLVSVSELVNWPSKVAKVESSSLIRVLLNRSGSGMSKRGCCKPGEDKLFAADTQGMNSSEAAEDRGTETLIRSGQSPRPVVMPTNDTVQGRWYTASGEVCIGPVDS